MKKILIVSLMVLLTSGVCVQARTTYDETGRHVVVDTTIRGQKRAAHQRAMEKRAALKEAKAAQTSQQTQTQQTYAAAGRIDYSKTEDSVLETDKKVVRTGRVQPVTKTVGVVRK